MKNLLLRSITPLCVLLSLLGGCSDEPSIAPEKTALREQKEFPITEANKLRESSPESGRIEATSCGTSVDGSYYGSGFYVYPDRPLDLSNVATGATVTVYCSAHDVPNRIAVYRGGSTWVASTGWIGYTSNPGPWGSSLSGPSTQTITFTKGSTNDYVIRTETVTQGISDYWVASISCPAPPPSCCVTSGGSQSGSYSGSGYYTYPDRTITYCSTAVGKTGVVSCTAMDTPNRFNIYSGGNLVASSGWIGYSSNPGPWGSSLNGPGSKTVTFAIGSNTTFQLRVETVTQTQSDSWSASAGCQN